MKILRSFALWMATLVVVVGASLVLNPNASTSASRITHLESLVRCPSCEDLSVAQSNATASLAVRREIAQKVHQGRSDSEILTSLESTYGTAILLSPPTSGLGALLWAVPAGVLAVMLVIGLRIARRRR